MKLVDTNLLLHAYDASSAFHPEARVWLQQAMSGTEPVGLAWTVVFAFLRLTTSPRILHRPLLTADAVRIVDEWLSRPNVGFLGPTEEHWRIFKQVVAESGVRGNAVMDAHLAALAIEHGATLYSADKDFRRFAGLRLVNPLEP